jgi:predicted hotdog family 3-hydroxylacyl-ACP dehydratase
MNERPILSGEAVSALIPQKPPIEMVDKLWFSDEHKTVSGFSIKADNLFCSNGYFTEAGIIENMAQTAALGTGYTASRQNNGGKPPIGFIGAIKKLLIHRLPDVGSELLTEVNIQQIIFDVTLITASSTVNGEKIAECEMKIFLKKN